MVLTYDSICPCEENDDDHDSGTESDDEGADAEELEKYLEDSLASSSAPSTTDEEHRASSTLDTLTVLSLPSDASDTWGATGHSSEEELEVINCCSKRKWCCDEERDLVCASAPLVEFRASPPLSPPKLFHIPPHELACTTPRKRHRKVDRPSLDFEKMQQNRRKRTGQGYVARGKSYILCENTL